MQSHAKIVTTTHLNSRTKNLTRQHGSAGQHSGTNCLNNTQQHTAPNTNSSNSCSHSRLTCAATHVSAVVGAARDDAREELGDEGLEALGHADEEFMRKCYSCTEGEGGMECCKCLEGKGGEGGGNFEDVARVAAHVGQGGCSVLCHNSKQLCNLHS